MYWDVSPFPLFYKTNNANLKSNTEPIHSTPFERVHFFLITDPSLLFESLVQFCCPRASIPLPRQSSSLVRYFSRSPFVSFVLPHYHMLTHPQISAHTQMTAQLPVDQCCSSPRSILQLSNHTSSVCWQRCCEANFVFLWQFRWRKACTLTSLQLVCNAPKTDRETDRHGFENFLHHVNQNKKDTPDRQNGREDWDNSCQHYKTIRVH